MINDEANIRRDYAQGKLSRATLAADPLVQFDGWLNQAISDNEADATAMSLATVNADGQPSARIVLLKGHDAQGFIWYTSYNSQKGLDLAHNAKAALLFYWRESERQVRISGSVSQLPLAVSQAYFQTRPKESQISALASAQSEVVAKRAELEARVEKLKAQYADGEVPLPPQWGGYVLAPETYEFWQGRVGRLHDRFRYTRTAQDWQIDRLQP